MSCIDLSLAGFRKNDVLEWSVFSQCAEAAIVELSEGTRNLFTVVKTATTAEAQFLRHGETIYNGDSFLLLSVGINKECDLCQYAIEWAIIKDLPGGLGHYNAGHVYRIFIDSRDGTKFRDLYINITGRR